MLSSSISKDGFQLMLRLIFIKKLERDIEVPVVGIGFFVFHFFDLEYMKHEMGQSKTVCGRLMYCDGVNVNVRLAESHLPVILDAMMYGFRWTFAFSIRMI